jgi:hypothetical protein
LGITYTVIQISPETVLVTISGYIPSYRALTVLTIISTRGGLAYDITYSVLKPGPETVFITVSLNVPCRLVLAVTVVIVTLRNLTGWVTD